MEENSIYEQTSYFSLYYCNFPKPFTSFLPSLKMVKVLVSKVNPFQVRLVYKNVSAYAQTETHTPHTSIIKVILKYSIIKVYCSIMVKNKSKNGI